MLNGKFEKPEKKEIRGEIPDVSTKKPEMPTDPFKDFESKFHSERLKEISKTIELDSGEKRKSVEPIKDGPVVSLPDREVSKDKQGFDPFKRFESIYHTEKSREVFQKDESNQSDIANDVSEDEKSKLAEIDDADRNMARTPENHGHWEGERGNSKWIPDAEYIPPEKSSNPEKPYSNPNKLSWAEILKKYGIDGITFKDGFPDFSEVSRGTVEIEGFETGGNAEKNRNFKKADIELAKQRGCSPEEVKKWREENNYTWHECEDKKTMQKVPNEVHANVPHDGGRSQKE